MYDKQQNLKIFQEAGNIYSCSIQDLIMDLKNTIF